MRLRSLAIVLNAKIAVTICLWCIPLLVFPVSWLQRLGFPMPQPEIFLRLLGMAYAALVVGYLFGLHSTRHNIYPAGVVWVGIVSNGGAFAILCIAAMSSVWDTWGQFAQLFMWASLIATGTITIGMVVFGPCRQVAHDNTGGSCPTE